MFLVQTAHAKRRRKYSILMIFVLLLTGSLGPLLTLHLEVMPPKRK
jgi:hypothetical protein